jgi:small GTP-binding protein
VRDREIIKKICLLGADASGKRALIKPLVYHMFDDRYVTTVGSKVTKKSVAYDIVVEGKPLQVHATFLLWDILGQKQYSKLHPVYYQGAEGGIVFCSTQSQDTVDSVPEWLRSFQEVVGPMPVAAIVNAGSAAAIERVDVASLRAAWGEPEIPVFVTSLETPERTDAALIEYGRGLVEEYVRRVGLPVEEGPTPGV